ncbi:Cof-type HAD-IIB family hydrolase [Paenibacillus sinopodophylli]|uniref:Cof-type HAD-IIB family hydrolase n=1 Tax=Paenibacillus sinopodophylli TaxID=1837342 RepID=UPI00110C93D1|nr:Cof-type HAD-IIB family hydrolase [Paenibacillus sinopodophylli]
MEGDIILRNIHFLTDLDGTLLLSDATLSAYTVDVISRAMEQGAVISYATARSYMSSNHIVSVIPWKHPIVLYNGAVIYDPLTMKVIGGHWLDNSVANSIVDIGRAHALLPFIFALDENDKERALHEKLTGSGSISFYESRPNDPRFSEMTNLACPDSFRTLKVTYIGLLHELEPLRDEVVRRFDSQVHIHLMKDSYIANHYFLEFGHPNANKKEGLRQWAKLVGCKPEDVTVFGDNLNDLGMFETAGAKVAVSNAHPALHELATYVALSNDEDGVAVYIKDVAGCE